MAGLQLCAEGEQSRASAARAICSGECECDMVSARNRERRRVERSGHCRSVRGEFCWTGGLALFAREEERNTLVIAWVQFVEHSRRPQWGTTLTTELTSRES